MAHSKPLQKQLNKQPTNTVIATNKLITTVGDLAMEIRQLCNRADISPSQRRALTEAHKWLAEFGIEQYTYEAEHISNRHSTRRNNNGNRK